MLHQTKLKYDINGEGVGNCFATCIANLLNRRIEDIPNVEVFFKHPKKSYWIEVFMDWCEMEGYEYEVIDSRGYKRNELYMANGFTERGTMHSVIYKNGELFFDPFPNGNGLVQVEYFTCLRKKN